MRYVVGIAVILSLGYHSVLSNYDGDGVELSAKGGQVLRLSEGTKLRSLTAESHWAVADTGVNPRTLWNDVTLDRSDREYRMLTGKGGREPDQMYHHRPLNDSMREKLLGQERRRETFNSTIPDCPEAAAIAPCVCFASNETFTLTLDCSEVESHEQLVAVFQKNFPVKNVTLFTLRNNPNITFLDDIFNGVFFDDFRLFYNVNLELITDYCFIDSLDTLNYLYIDGSALHAASFPFASLGLYSNLEGLVINHALQLTSLPKIISDTLTYIDFLGSGITSIDPDAFDAVPNLNLIRFNLNNVKTLLPGTFNLIADMVELNMFKNGLATIEPGAFVVPENSNTSLWLPIYLFNNSLTELVAGSIALPDRPLYISLHDNLITNIQRGAFVLPTTTDWLDLEFSLSYNLLTTIDEAVWGELFPFINSIYFEGNPLLCGCDIAWLVTNLTYTRKVDRYTTCPDGQTLWDIALDPWYYVEFC